MRKLFRTIRQFFKNRKDKKEVKTAIVTLEKAAKTKKRQRLELKVEITKLIRSYAKFYKDDISEYIPFDPRTKEEIKFQVNLKFGEEMKRLNVKLTNKLQLV